MKARTGTLIEPERIASSATNHFTIFYLLLYAALFSGYQVSDHLLPPLQTRFILSGNNHVFKQVCKVSCRNKHSTPLHNIIVCLSYHLYIASVQCLQGFYIFLESCSSRDKFLVNILIINLIVITGNLLLWQGSLQCNKETR